MKIISLVLAGLMFLVGGVSSGVVHGSSVGSQTVMGHDGAGEVVVAKVNGVSVDMASLMDRMLDLAQKRYGRREISNLVALKIKDEAMDQLIVEELAFQKALAEVGEIPGDKIEEKITHLKDEMGGEDGLAEYLQKEQIDMTELRHLLRRSLTVKTFIENKIERDVTVSEDEIKEAYFGAKDKYFEKEEMVQVNQITLFLKPGSKEASSKVEEIKEKIKAHGNDASKLIPDGTFIVQDNIKLDKVNDKKLYFIAKELGPDGISAPVEVDGTLYMVQLTGFQPEVTRDIEDVYDYLVGELKKRKIQALKDQWISGLKNGAQIEIIDITN